jgi:hypothetical protein
MPAVRQCSIHDIQDEVRALVDRGSISRQNYIYELCRHFSPREWQEIEPVLEEHDYLLRDHVIDLIGKESWLSD